MYAMKAMGYFGNGCLVKAFIIFFSFFGVHAKLDEYSMRHIEDRTVFLPGETVTMKWRLARRGTKPLVGCCQLSVQMILCYVMFRANN